MPLPRWLKSDLAADNPAHNWKQFNVDTQHSLQIEGGMYRRVIPYIVPATQPKGSLADPSNSWQVETTGNGPLVLRSTESNRPPAIQILTGGSIDADGGINPASTARLRYQPVAAFAPNNVGLVIDSAGHLLVPLYVEKEDAPEGVKVCVGHGAVVKASFVGSDRPSMLTLFRNPDSAARPIKVGAAGRLKARSSWPSHRTPPPQS